MTKPPTAERVAEEPINTGDVNVSVKTSAHAEYALALRRSTVLGAHAV